MASLKKKYDKAKDWQYLTTLYKKCDDDEKTINQLIKDNKFLKTQ